MALDSGCTTLHIENKNVYNFLSYYGTVLELKCLCNIN